MLQRLRPSESRLAKIDAIVQASKRHRPDPENTGPIHILHRHGHGRREEGDDKNHGQIDQGQGVDRGAELAEIPGTGCRGRVSESLPEVLRDVHEVAAVVGGDDEGGDGREGGRAADYDQAEERGNLRGVSLVEEAKDQGPRQHTRTLTIKAFKGTLFRSRPRYGESGKAPSLAKAYVARDVAASTAMMANTTVARRRTM